MILTLFRLTAPVVFAVCLFTAAIAQVDLTDAHLVFAPSAKGKTDPGVIVLQEEIKSRTGLTIPVVSRLKTGSNLLLALEEDVFSLPPAIRGLYLSLPAIQKEGYKVVTDSTSQTVAIVGKDQRGLFYGVGRFLRKAELSKGRIAFPASYTMATSPRYPVRGHQLGYRPKTNSYDAFTVAQFDQYIRELALFGANSIEIMPPRTDDAFESRHMKIPAIDMNREQSRICAKYGLDVWMWYPNLAKQYRDPETVKKELAEREEVFKVVPKLNAVFAPGGDPGDLEPDELFEWMGKVAAVLTKYHPDAKIWISPQSFRPDKPWFDAFFAHVNKGYPWLGGIVYGPWVKVPIEEVRARIPASVPIRNYPDITHSLACQYPVPDWDPAWALTLGREAVNPRPYDQKLFHNALASYCVGSISYSEGTNDDVNKFIWSDQDWNPDTDVRETLEDYSRLFFGSRLAFRGARALIALEESHRGSLLAKTTVMPTLKHWQGMEREASVDLLRNPRFQMGLIRAYFDAYTQERLIYETNLERRALEILEHNRDAKAAISKAISILQSAWASPIRTDLSDRCLALADSLFASIGAQLTIEKHGAMSGRGNFIDNIRFPLNNGPWLVSELERIAGIGDAVVQRDELRKLCNRTDPGPGGFYDRLASMESRKRIVSDFLWEEDPGSLKSPRTGFGISLPDNTWYRDIPGVAKKVPLAPANWNNQIEVLYNTPLRVRYDDLEKGAKYKIKLVYTGRFKSTVRLTTDQGELVHGDVKVGQQPVYEFDIPASATADGRLELIWHCKEAERGVQVAEIWLTIIEVP